jgi:hypothetical protein
MPAPEALGKMVWRLPYGTHGVRKYVGFDSLDRQAGWHATFHVRNGSACGRLALPIRSAGA